PNLRGLEARALARHSRWNKMRSLRAGAKVAVTHASSSAAGRSYASLQVWRYAHPVPFLFRGWSSFWDAVQEWAADSYSREDEEGRKLSHLHRRVPLKKRAAQRIGDALGLLKADYIAAKVELLSIVAEAKKRAGLPESRSLPYMKAPEPELGVAFELERYVL